MDEKKTPTRNSQSATKKVYVECRYRCKKSTYSVRSTYVYSWKQHLYHIRATTSYTGNFRPYIRSRPHPSTRSLPNTLHHQVEALNATAYRSSTEAEAAIFTLSDFVDSLNSTDVGVSLLDFYTNAEVNGSLLLAPDCPYNVSFGGEEATEYLGRPWLALPTVDSAAAVVVAADDDENGSTATNETTSSEPQTSWEAGGMRQSFGRQGGAVYTVQ